jgi:hypothetical protein
MIKHRNRFKQTTPPKGRLIRWAKKVRKRARQLASGAQQENMFEKVRQAETTARLDESASSSGLQAPK